MTGGNDARQSLGKLGERLALDFLRRQRYRIHETNFRCRFGELDIVASEGNVLVFVEVRTRSSAAFGAAEESVTARKQRKLSQVAEAYLQARYQQEAFEQHRVGRKAAAGRPTVPPPLPAGRLGELPLCRIDVVVIALARGGQLERIELIRGAVQA